jgi:hypothetical protein
VLAVSRWLAIRCNIFSTDISQIAKGFEPQSDQLFIKRIQFAHRGNVEQHPTEAANIAFKGALGRNEATEEVCSFWVADFDAVELFSDGVKEGSDGFVGCGVQHDRSPECLGYGFVI